MMWKLVTNEVGILMDEQLGTGGLAGGVEAGSFCWVFFVFFFLTQPSRLNWLKLSIGSHV